MTFERNPGPPPEAAPTPASHQGAEPTPVQIRLQILSTEHWSLLASRGLAWNESFARAGMYLSTLTGLIVALSLIGGVDGFQDAFFAAALILLPVMLFVGLGTWLRLGATNYHDAVAVGGMNRIRAAYLEIAPDLAPYFVMGTHDDARGIGVTMAVPPGTSHFVHLIAGTPTLVIVLNGIVAGATVALAVVRYASADGIATTLAAVVVSTLVVAAQTRIAHRNIRRLQGSVKPMFPSPAGPEND